MPNFTVVPPVKPTPEIETVVPPANGPTAGVTLVTSGTAKYVNWSAAKVAEVPPRSFTVTSTGPAAFGGLVAVICVDETRVTLVAAVPPKSTIGCPRKPVPVMVTDVPPAKGPAVATRAVTVGDAT